MNRCLAVVFISFFCLLLSMPAARAQIDDQGAARLKTMLETLINTHRQHAATRQGTLKTEGEVLIEKKDTYYAASLPAATYVGPDGARMAMGKIAINAMPGEAPDLWKMAVALPSPIRFYEGDSLLYSLTFSGQSTNGIWNDTLGSFVKLDSRLETITLKQEGGLTEVTVPRFSALYDLSEGAKGLWSGPMRIAASGVKALIASESHQPDATVEIGDVTFDYRLKDVSSVEVHTFQEQMRALRENAADPTAGQTASGAHAQAVYGLVAQYLRKAFDAASGQLRVKDLKIQPHKAESAQVFIKDAGIGIDLSGFRSGRVAIGFGGDYSGMSIAPPPETLGPLAPDALRVKLVLDQVPLDKILDLAKPAVDSAATSGAGAGKMALMQSAIALPALLSEAGTKVVLENNRISSALYEATLTGTAIAKAEAAQGAVVNGRMEVTGIEEVIAWMKQRTIDAPDQKADMAQALKVLTALQLVGQQSKTPQGKPSRIYDFVLNEQGQALLNGTDINALAGMIEGGGESVKSINPAPPAPR